MRPLWGKFLFILPHPSSRNTLCEAIWGGVSVHAATPLIEDPGLPDVQSGLKGSRAGGGGELDCCHRDRIVLTRSWR